MLWVYVALQDTALSWPTEALSAMNNDTTLPFSFPAVCEKKSEFRCGRCNAYRSGLSLTHDAEWMHASNRS